ncbi:MAG: phosphotransferase [Pseudomonadota bacterium]
MKNTTALFYLDDPLFPSLAVAVDAQRMARYFEGLLSAPGEWRLTACRLERLRYRRATRCILHYEINLRRHADGAEQVVWLMAYLYADQKKLRSRQRRLDMLGAAHDEQIPMPRYAFLDELAILVTRFPTDHALPALCKITADLPGLFGSRCAAVFGAEEWRMLDMSLEPVRWRAGLSAVMRARVRGEQQSGEQAERRFYVKVYAPASAGLVAPPGYAPAPAPPFKKVVDTVFHDAIGGIEIQRAATGTPLLSLLMQQCADHGEAVRLATALADWHLSDAILKRRLSLIDLTAAMERVAHTLSAALPYLHDTVAATLNRIRQTWTESVFVPAHLDLKPDHIFFAAGDVTFIDLESAANADPMLDLAHLLARLHYAQALYQVPDRHARQFAAHVYESYRGQVPRGWLGNLLCCYAWSLLQIAANVFEHQRPGWAAWVYQLAHTAAAMDLANPNAFTRLLEAETELHTPYPPLTNRLAMEIRP